jgi:hypothetical protein
VSESSQAPATARGVLTCRKKALSAEATVQNELVMVQKLAAVKTKQLIRAADVHIGLEVMHLFICDLLGRGRFNTLH